MEKVPDYETGGCRFDSCRRHRSTRRSSAEQSIAFRTRRSHVRIVPARRRRCSEAIRPDEEPVSNTGKSREALVGASPTASSTHFMRLRHCYPAHAAMVERSRRRALNPEAGVRLPVAVLMPGSRAERRPAVTRKAAVRSRPWQLMSENAQVVVVQRRGSRCAIPRMRVRVPPATQNTQHTMTGRG
jgi:hypothetical protein